MRYIIKAVDGPCITMITEYQMKHENLTQFWFNPFNPEFTIVAILDLQWMKIIWSGWKRKKKLSCIDKPVS